MIDPNKSAALERAAVFLVVAVVFLIGWAMTLPYLAVYLDISLSEALQAMFGNIVSVLENVLVMIVSFFFGATLNRSRDADTTNKALTLATAAINPTPTPDKTVTVAPGETASVIAEAEATNPSAT
jgi:hypothetical protein